MKITDIYSIDAPLGGAGVYNGLNEHSFNVGKELINTRANSINTLPKTRSGLLIVLLADFECDATTMVALIDYIDRNMEHFSKKLYENSELVNRDINKQILITVDGVESMEVFDMIFEYDFVVKGVIPLYENNERGIKFNSLGFMNYFKRILLNCKAGEYGDFE